MQSIEFDPDELDVAMQWHGGQSSMLYAVASTGALRIGTESFRPNVEMHRDGKMSDDQWLAYLAGKLASEAEKCAADALLRLKRAKRARRPGDAREMADHVVALDDIVAKCRAAILALASMP